MTISTNQLGSAASPYLIQHKDNPVHWQMWGDDALAAARASGKPILLSVGYAACHWCHVMAHESFEDEATAALMNRLFVNIKVDREEHPEIDAIYQQALAVMGQQGGWPLTMFLTPDAEPFWGGTYFPPEDNHGRPGFKRVLQQVADLFQSADPQLNKNRESIRNQLAALSQPQQQQSQMGLNPAMLDMIAKRLCRQVDPFHGGMGEAPKFPQTSTLALLGRAYLRSGAAPFGHAFDLSLMNMSEGGLYDHIGGGYARYSVDEQWLVPHFEKMLYDNAGLLHLLAFAATHLGAPLYRQRLIETADYVVREMQRPEGGFGATYDADSEGEEGKFYVWSPDEIIAVLGTKDGARFNEAYDISETGNFEGKNILNRLHRLNLFDEPEQAALAPLRAKLFAAREQRIKPGFDDKVLADWNGMMIAALVDASLAASRPDYLDGAIRAYDFVMTTLYKAGRLHHAWRNGTWSDNETLDDYAQMAWGALALYRATGNARFIDDAQTLVACANNHFSDNNYGGYFMTPANAAHLITRPRSALDNAAPSGNGTMVHVLVHLYGLTGKADYQSRATQTINGFVGELNRSLMGVSTLLNGYEALSRPIQIVIAASTQTAAAPLAQIARAALLPDTIVQITTPDTALPDTNPAFGKTMQNDLPTAYVCIGPQCSLPLTDADALRDALRPERIYPRKLLV